MSPAIPPSPALPPVLRDVRAVVQGHWRATSEELYREIARLVDVGPGSELLIVGCGDGVTAEWLAGRTGATVMGVDADRARVERAERRVRAAPVRQAVSFEHHAPESLPHEADVFDASLGEPFLAAAGDPSAAVAELVRVTKPMGVVVLLQLTWSTEISDSTRGLLVERLGIRPHHLVEWKQMLRDAGVVDIDVQDWSDGPLGRSARTSGEWARARAGGTPASRAPRLSLPQKVHIVGRAWRRWGWRTGAVGAALGALDLEAKLLCELSRERAVGFQLIRGVKWPRERRAARREATT